MLLLGRSKLKEKYSNTKILSPLIEIYAMLLILKIAFLNVLRNSRRSLITILAIVFGSISLIVFGGFVEAMYEGLRESMIHSQLGHLQIYKKGFNKYAAVSPEEYFLSADMVKKVIKIVEEQPGVEIVTKRINFSGLLSNGNTSIGVIGVGIDAENESLISSAITILDGEDLFAEERDGALIGQGLAESLHINVGDVLTLLSSTIDGSMNAVDITTSGIFSTGIKELDDRIIRANFSHIQDLLYTENTSRIVVLLEETETTEQMKHELESIFAQKNMDLEMKTWSDLATFYHKVVRLFQGVFGFIKIIVMVIVVLGVSNTMLMAVMERTSEIGTIRALGNTRSEILFLFLTESVYLGLFGGGLGILAGMLAAKGLTAADFFMPAPPGSTSGFPIRIFIIDYILWESLVLGIGSSMIGSAYPAIKASRLKIVDALRFA